jgi:hypothetical protein
VCEDECEHHQEWNDVEILDADDQMRTDDCESEMPISRQDMTDMETSEQRARRAAFENMLMEADGDEEVEDFGGCGSQPSACRSETGARAKHRGDDMEKGSTMHGGACSEKEADDDSDDVCIVESPTRTARNSLETREVNAESLSDRGSPGASAGGTRVAATVHAVARKADGESGPKSLDSGSYNNRDNGASDASARSKKAKGVVIDLCSDED